MITRPLDLASKLRPAPRSFDGLFFVMVGAIVLFFGVFGSRFVLAPGLGVEFRLPAVTGAAASAKAPTHVISVTASGKVFMNDGLRTLEELAGWLQSQPRGAQTPVLGVRADIGVPLAVIAEISSAARVAGFDFLLFADEPEGTRTKATR